MNRRRGPVLLDGRWMGRHGIARFAREIISRLDLPSVPVSSRVPLLHPAEPLALAALAYLHHPSVYFTPAFNVPIAAPCPIIATVHDLIHLQGIGEGSRSKELYYQRVLRPILRRSPYVITVSESSKAELVSWLGVSDERVVVVGDGPSFERTARKDLAAEIDGPFVLYVGNAKPHKNLERLKRAFLAADLPEEVKLVIVGLAHETSRDQRIVTTGSIDDQRLEGLYRSATMLAIPSLYEGFGLPALEAMSVGTPVLAGDIPSLREVAGPAAHYVEPRVAASITEGIERLFADDTSRAEMIEAGFVQATKYSWDDSAKRLQLVLEDVIE